MNTDHTRNAPGPVIAPKAIIKVLLIVWGLVAMAGLYADILPFWVAGEMSKFQSFLFELFQFDREANLPTWFSSILLLGNGLLLALIASGAQQLRRQWFCLSCLFFLLSLDEVASLHEAAGRFASRVALGGEGTSFAWVVLALPLLLVLYLAYRKFLAKLPARTRSLVMVSAAIYISGAVLIEIAGWLYSARSGHHWAGYLTLTYFEEALEMLGQIAFSYALLDFLARHQQRFSFSYR